MLVDMDKRFIQYWLNGVHQKRVSRITYEHTFYWVILFDIHAKNTVPFNQQTTNKPFFATVTLFTSATAIQLSICYLYYMTVLDVPPKYPLSSLKPYADPPHGPTLPK